MIVTRRFNQFKQLHAVCGGDEKFGPFPLKHFFTQFDTMVVEERKAYFQKMMNIIKDNPELQIHPQIVEFFTRTDYPSFL